MPLFTPLRKYLRKCERAYAYFVSADATHNTIVQRQEIIQFQLPKLTEQLTS